MCLHMYVPAPDKTFSDEPGNKERRRKLEELEKRAPSPLTLCTCLSQIKHTYLSKLMIKFILYAKPVEKIEGLHSRKLIYFSGKWCVGKRRRGITEWDGDGGESLGLGLGLGTETSYLSPSGTGRWVCSHIPPNILLNHEHPPGIQQRIRPQPSRHPQHHNY